MAIVTVVAGQVLNVGGATTFAGLTDVSLSNLENGQVPVFDFASGKWKNGSPSVTNALTLNGQPGSYYLSRANHTGAMPAADVAQSSAMRFASDAEKATWNAKQSALGYTPENTANKGQANGYPSLDNNGKIDPGVLPPLSVNNITTVANQAARLALNAKVGDAAKQSDNLSTYMLSALPATNNANWIEIGDISPDWSAIENKPTAFPPVIGTGATQAAAGNDPRLSDARTPTTHTHTASQITDFSSAVTAAMQSALNAKADKATTPQVVVAATMPPDTSGYPIGTIFIIG